MTSALQPEWLESAGLWVGFVFTLLIFSALFGDHLLARFAQYTLVGAVLGYAAVVTWQSIWTSKLILSLRTDPQAAPWNWLPVMLAGIMAIAGIERIVMQGRAAPAPRGWRKWLRAIGSVPALALVAIGVAVALIGTLQGTLAPQFLAAARGSLEWGAPPAPFAAGVLTLLLTTATLVFFVVDTDRHLNAQPGWARRLARVVIWVGQRAVWLAAGVLFARLFASRLSLFIAELAHWRAVLQASEASTILDAWWRLVTGA